MARSYTSREGQAGTLPAGTFQNIMKDYKAYAAERYRSEGEAAQRDVNKRIEAAEVQAKVLDRYPELRTTNENYLPDPLAFRVTDADVISQDKTGKSLPSSTWSEWRVKDGNAEEESSASEYMGTIEELAQRRTAEFESSESLYSGLKDAVSDIEDYWRICNTLAKDIQNGMTEQAKNFDPEKSSVEYARLSKLAVRFKNSENAYFEAIDKANSIEREVKDLFKTMDRHERRRDAEDRGYGVGDIDTGEQE